MNIKFFEPSDKLKKYIRSYYILDKVNCFDYIPDLIPGTGEELMINLSGPFSFFSKNQDIIIDKNVLFSLRKNIYRIESFNPVKIFGIRFRVSQIQNFIKINLFDLKNEFYDPENIFEQFNIPYNFPEFSDRSLCYFFDEYFESKLDVYNKKNDIMEHSVNAVFYHFKDYNLENISKETGLSPRNFERKFKLYSGFTFKNFKSYARFYHTFKQIIFTKEKNYKDIIFNNDYYDQSHFINAFKFFTGTNPGKYLNDDNFNNHYLVK